MKSRSSTSDRILETGRKLFNEKGYAATTLTEIAAAVGISQGNLTYHFSTKRELAMRIGADARERAQARRAHHTPGAIEDDYMEHLLFAMDLTWNNRFLLQDRAQYTELPNAQQSDSEMTADFNELHGLLKRAEKEDMFRRDLELDLHVLTRSLWIVSRYWMDYLRESEGLEKISWADQERGIQHHFAVLLPCLTASARRNFEAAFERLNAVA